MSRSAKLYARISPRLANRPGSRLFTKAHGRLMRISRGRLGKFLGAELLLLRTIGRRSGQPRETPLMFLRHRGALVVVAANAAARATPAWWLNLQADPEAEVLVDRSWQPVRARQAGEREAAEVWPGLVEMYWGNEHYRRIAERELPVVMLEPR